MNTRKSVLGWLAILGVMIAGMAMAPKARAQWGVYGPNTLTSGSTNDVRALTTNTLNKVMEVTQYKEVGLLLSFKMTGAGTSNVVFRLDESLDGSTWGSNQRLVFALAGNGTTAVNFITNINTTGIGYLRLTSADNTNASGTFTNVTVVISTKPRF
jgi:hypothetical protein